MKIEIEVPTEQLEALASDIFQNYPEASYGCALRCIGWRYTTMQFQFQDEEDGKIYDVELPLILNGLEKFIRGCMEGEFKFFEGRDLESLLDPCNYDATAVDVVLQLALFGEVIYG